MEPKIIGVKVAGNIISELSEKIPTQIVALNELIKNAYDAFATEVSIFLDLSNGKLIIRDNGKGMNEEDVENLFHLSKSKKQYGKLVFDSDLKINRRIQGSKGLGFLSVFKFGSKVKWITAKNGIELTFSANKDDIVKLKDISEYEVSLERKEVEYKGTKIEIDVDISSYAIRSLLEYLKQDKNALKIVNSFYDESFKIKLEFGAKKETKNKESFLKASANSILYKIKYSSAEKIIKFFFRGKKIKEVEFILTGEYHLDINLNIYTFKYKRSDKSKISDLFCREKDDSLTPLVYINANLFSNYELFDPDVMRSVKSSKMLPQMIGYINIESDSEDIDFNSDRTNLVNNELTDKIKKDLRKLNISIQDVGSELKDKYINELEEEKKDDDDDGKDEDEDEDDGSKPRIKPASIDLAENFYRYPVPSPQLDLYKFIVSAINSKGEKIAHEDIRIFIDNQERTKSILESINVPCRLDVQYRYNDVETGKCIKNLILNFYEDKKEIKGDDRLRSLICLPNKTYLIKIQFLPSLITQINKLAEFGGDYREVIACSLRALFDISVFELRDFLSQNDKHKSLYDDLKNKKELIDCVKSIIYYVRSNNHIIEKIKGNMGSDFDSLKNKLVEMDFCNAVRKSHMGAHKSTKHITDKDIDDIADKASYFVAIVNELIYVV
ncbi:hypothetical protein OFAG_02316 [Oxalobacter formigenes HOxBLS]|uniref:ATP-binding protein n=1 Tax=Oxalobacter paraformigenes TaxID=556268 RepID=T5LPE2_9BURK|nr:ATP-binding protein [Oxalobacter paraformigenes]EQM95092.1 hypothetical protein OFAG_02316 [Oxalobacter paraformigenes]